jgi:DNA-directed RNA polymerase subunit RPC12/RpoP
MDYQCMNCKKEFAIKEKVQCPFCGYRIVKKTRTPAIKLINAV